MTNQTFPTIDDIKTLPRWAVVAFAARCARHVYPLFAESDSDKQGSVALEEVISIAEEYASTAPFASNAIANRASDLATSLKYLPCYSLAQTIARAMATMAGHAAAHAVFFSGEEKTMCFKAASDTVEYWVETFDDIYSVDTNRKRKISDNIIRDFKFLKESSKRHKWTDDTPVAPDFFDTAESDKTEREAEEQSSIRKVDYVTF